MKDQGARRIFSCRKQNALAGKKLIFTVDFTIRCLKMCQICENFNSELQIILFTSDLLFRIQTA